MNNLRQWMLPLIAAKGLTIKEFLEGVGISKAALYKYFSDENRPDRRTMEKICAFLEVPVEDGLAQYSPRKEGRPFKAKDQQPPSEQ